MEIRPDNKPLYSLKDNKLLLIQIGKTFYSIKPYITITGTEELKELDNKNFDIRHLRED